MASQPAGLRESDRVHAVVVGAGPAGSAAAITLARAGHHVVLLDRSAFPRDKPCGDLVGARALALARRLGVAEARIAPYRPLAGALVTDGDTRLDLSPTTRVGRALVAGIDARVIPREVFDTALVDSALDHGVSLRQVAVRSVTPVEDGGREVTGEGPDGLLRLRARMIVIAGGYGCRVAGDAARTDGEAGIRAVAMRGYFQGVSAPPDRMVICLDRRNSSGYGWLFPLPDGCANVGVGALVSGTSRTHLRQIYTAFVEGPSSPAAGWLRGATPVSAPRAWPLDLGPQRRRLVADGLVVAGEAAALVGSLTGAGITFALESGMAAGQVAARALSNGDTGASALRPYAATIRRRCTPALRIEATAQHWLRRPAHARILLRGVRPVPFTGALGARLLLNLG